MATVFYVEKDNGFITTTSEEAGRAFIKFFENTHIEYLSGGVTGLTGFKITGKNINVKELEAIAIDFREEFIHLKPVANTKPASSGSVGPATETLKTKETVLSSSTTPTPEVAAKAPISNLSSAPVAAKKEDSKES